MAKWHGEVEMEELDVVEVEHQLRSRPKHRHKKSSKGAAGRPKGKVLGDNVRGCKSKVTMEKKTAIRAASRARKKTGESIWAYQCPTCFAWHIGHSVGRDREMRGEVG